MRCRMYWKHSWHDRGEIIGHGKDRGSGLWNRRQCIGKVDPAYVETEALSQGQAPRLFPKAGGGGKTTRALANGIEQACPQRGHVEAQKG